MTYSNTEKVSEHALFTQKESEVLDWFKFVLGITPIKQFIGDRGQGDSTSFTFHLGDIEVDIIVHSYKAQADFDYQVLPTFNSVNDIQSIATRSKEWQLLNDKYTEDMLMVLGNESYLTLQDPYGHILHLTSAKPSVGTSRKCGGC
jgi:hypothetical protein